MQVICVSDGKIVEAGPFQKLMASGGQFATMMKEVQVDQEEKEKEVSALAAAPAASVEGLAGSGGSNRVARLITDEASTQGAVGSEVFVAYIKAMGGMFWFSFLAFGYLMVEAIRVATTVWLSVWTGSTDTGKAGSAHTAMFYLVGVCLDLNFA